jgi:hypothetical protein
MLHLIMQTRSHDSRLDRTTFAFAIVAAQAQGHHAGSNQVRGGAYSCVSATLPIDTWLRRWGATKMDLAQAATPSAIEDPQRAR